MASIFRTATQYVANEITLVRGTVADITSVGVFHTADPMVVPTVEQFTTVLLVQPGEALAEGTKVDVLSLIGPKVGAHVALGAGDYQRWIKVSTAAEDQISRPDVLTVA